MPFIHSINSNAVVHYLKMGNDQTTSMDLVEKQDFVTLDFHATCRYLCYIAMNFVLQFTYSYTS